ncbi:MAG: PilT/PilU family type 4a pilus ATPase [Candidatus Gastranaerophilales bacterium]|nr:PilT/PilU family type 4a pilus ATPase [Candidatus Gastranaerophilales bacterium]
MSNFNLVEFLTKFVSLGVSDIHIKSGNPPIVRKSGSIEFLNAMSFTDKDIEQIITIIMPEHLKAKSGQFYDFDFSYEIKGVSRFRVNLCHELGKKALILRVIPYEVPSFNKLNLPPIIEQFTTLNNGIVMVTGPTGSGKSTTIASLLDCINQKYKKHIITIEDPVEFIYQNKKSVFTQRQLGIDTPDFANGVKYSLRQDPDIILIGEMRDRETITSALKAAETGHLVFSTLHTIDAVQTINRVINAFEPHERNQIRLQLASVLRGTISQKLLTKADNSGRIPAVEILTVTSTIKDYIIKDEIESIYEMVRNDNLDEMLNMNTSLYRLVKTGLVEKNTAIDASDFPNELDQMFRGFYQGINTFNDF